MKIIIEICEFIIGCALGAVIGLSLVICAMKLAFIFGDMMQFGWGVK